MRVITGTARGRNLETLPGEDLVRPTSQMMKETMFSAIQFYVAGAQILDLFSGSGQLGIEALSRGARRCVFVEHNRDSVDIIKRNLKRTGLYSAASVVTQDVRRYLKNCSDRFDIVFADPPYQTKNILDLAEDAATCVAVGGLLLFETASSSSLPDHIADLTIKKCYCHGQSRAWLFQKENTEI